MSIDKALIESKYKKALEKSYKNIEILNAAQRAETIERAKEYYHYLESHGIIYARLALEVVEDKAQYGQMANIHLKSQWLTDTMIPTFHHTRSLFCVLRLSSLKNLFPFFRCNTKW